MTFKDACKELEDMACVAIHYNIYNVTTFGYKRNQLSKAC